MGAILPRAPAEGGEGVKAVPRRRQRADRGQNATPFTAFAGLLWAVLARMQDEDGYVS